LQNKRSSARNRYLLIISIFILCINKRDLGLDIEVALPHDVFYNVRSNMLIGPQIGGSKNLWYFYGVSFYSCG